MKKQRTLDNIKMNWENTYEVGKIQKIMFRLDSQIWNRKRRCSKRMIQT
jgi:hypothetical protein